jgi:hypothetical protein
MILGTGNHGLSTSPLVYPKVSIIIYIFSGVYTPIKWELIGIGNITIQ